MRGAQIGVCGARADIRAVSVGRTERLPASPSAPSHSADAHSGTPTVRPRTIETHAWTVVAPVSVRPTVVHVEGLFGRSYSYVVRAGPLDGCNQPFPT